ncbi:corepressor interacting with RBPJ 1-like [Meleagris gallopavo]|uniref:corepressor interacting with RBPJ 1-like n=1 Tax=Meleagris gallopavo TaxID=9103 RepID=UPI000549A9D4|nr:corepressor interacting with RBPJ 1-like [Meleagris gallopavo]
MRSVRVLGGAGLMPSRLSSFTAPLLFLFSSKAFGDGALDQAFVSLGMDNQKDEKGRLLSAASAEDLKVRGKEKRKRKRSRSRSSSVSSTSSSSTTSTSSSSSHSSSRSSSSSSRDSPKTKSKRRKKEKHNKKVNIF